MRKTKCVSTKYKNEQQKYQLKGWTNDQDDLENSSNLLKILQKKITLPMIDHSGKFGKLNNCKQSSLFNISEEKNSKNLQLIKIQNRNLQSTKKVKNIIQNDGQQNKQKVQKCQSKRQIAQKKLSNIEQLKQIIKTAKDEKQKQKQLSKNQSHGHFYKQTYLQQELTVQQKIKQKKNAKVKHQKIASLATLPVKIQLTIFQNRGLKNCLGSQEQTPIKSQKKTKHNIKWDRFSISQQKIIPTIKVSTQKSEQKKQKRLYQRCFEKSQRVRIRTEQSPSSKLLWLDKAINQMNLKNTPKQRIMTTQTKDFVDEHLQTYMPKLCL